MRKVLWMAVMVMMAVGMNAQQPAKVPAYRGMIERVQPSGDTLRTFLRGDERMHWMMTEDGWQIMEDKKGWLKYVTLRKNGKQVISCRKAHNAEDRSKCERRWLEKKGVMKMSGETQNE